MLKMQSLMVRKGVGAILRTMNTLVALTKRQGTLSIDEVCGRFKLDKNVAMALMKLAARLDVSLAFDSIQKRLVYFNKKPLRAITRLRPKNSAKNSNGEEGGAIVPI